MVREPPGLRIERTPLQSDGVSKRHKQGGAQPPNPGRRILTWAPEPDEEDERFDEPELVVEDEAPAEPPRRVEARRASGLGLSSAAPRTVRPGLVPAGDGEEADAPAKRKRGRPRGRAVRRQVHFHVDPQEEQLLLAAVARYGSQQKGLIAALMSLQEADRLRDEIERLRDECERQQRLLEEAHALFRR